MTIKLHEFIRLPKFNRSTLLLRNQVLRCAVRIQGLYLTNIESVFSFRVEQGSSLPVDIAIAYCAGFVQEKMERRFTTNDNAQLNVLSGCVQWAGGHRSPSSGCLHSG